uniref:Uncharacterized protein n=1 Tax=Quercus lobata TaxID=97700 RepID=A0A7N2R559_QUELO
MRPRTIASEDDQDVASPRSDLRRTLEELTKTANCLKNEFEMKDLGYLSNPHKGQSQTGYLFTYENTAISWRSVKQTISATSSNHAEIIAIHEASRECVWLRSDKFRKDDGNDMAADVVHKLA